jgi:hypothetical protein
MNENYVLKQLEWLQAVITRMASNSFLLKGWAVTLTTALLALSTKDADRTFAILAIYPTLVLWALDAYYLQLERKFRAQFEEIARPFSLGIAQQTVSRSYASAVFARATWPTYVAISMVTALIAVRTSLW